MKSIYLKIVLMALVAASVESSAGAASPSLVKVAKPPALKPLKLSVHGRVLAAPTSSVDGLGAEDYASQWPGTYFEAAFKGTELFFGVGPSHEILHVLVDGRIDEQAPLVLTDPQAGVYRISGLENKKHTVKLLVATESQSAPNHFEGFGITASEAPLVPTKLLRQIEFIGDSHTVGYGNTSSKRECSADEIWATTDNTQAFGPLTATHFRADYEVNAISGRGVVRNYNGGEGDTLPEAYPYLLFDKKVPSADHDWKPKLIVIALGTNDFSTALNAGEKWKTRDELRSDYETQYVRFLESLRARNPSAYFILWATDLEDGEIASEEQRVVNRMKSQGEQKITYIPVQHLSFSGCDWHPSVADDKTISDKLVHFVDAHPEIWQDK